MASVNNIDRMRKYDAIIRRIKEELVKRDWSQKILAQRIGQREDWLSRRMTQGTILSVPELLKIADTLEIDPASLLTDETEPKRETFQEYCRGVIRQILEEELINKIK